MRRLGFVLFVAGLFFLILSLGHFYITSVMAENRMIAGLEAALPWYLLPAAAGLVIMVVGICLRLLCRAPGQPAASRQDRASEAKPGE